MSVEKFAKVERVLTAIAASLLILCAVVVVLQMPQQPAEMILDTMVEIFSYTGTAQGQ
ncbi:hypothetical protein SAMN06273572_101148 [Monaibacterium marinum]|uniref:Uncharacterized protein n=1 Tax=Pontivivens marinum TaxID=1690039 RepID=A0A2C9CLR6_9RHOB|nr:hypothetical protein [Monaibacterium marinum]SOH92306.1 hypothetical protein SAMN06273572_101148 [Monaibacterium marinum]